VVRKPVAQARQSSDDPLPVRIRVSRTLWGKGVRQAYEGAKIIVRFDETGKKTLSLDAGIESGLLEAAG
jgi:hypothetical protein